MHAYNEEDGTDPRWLLTKKYGQSPVCPTCKPLFSACSCCGVVTLSEEQRDVNYPRSLSAGTELVVRKVCPACIPKVAFECPDCNTLNRVTLRRTIGDHCTCRACYTVALEAMTPEQRAALPQELSPEEFRIQVRNYLRGLPQDKRPNMPAAWNVGFCPVKETDAPGTQPPLYIRQTDASRDTYRYDPDAGAWQTVATPPPASLQWQLWQ